MKLLADVVESNRQIFVHLSSQFSSVAEIQREKIAIEKLKAWGGFIKWLSEGPEE